MKKKMKENNRLGDLETSKKIEKIKINYKNPLALKFNISLKTNIAPMAELVDASDSKSDSARSAGSIPARGTTSTNLKVLN
jgi:hypothetical protein